MGDPIEKRSRFLTNIARLHGLDFTTGLSEENYDLPTFEVFCDSLKADTERHKFFEDVKLHQMLFCTVKELMGQSGVVVRLLCTHGEPRRDLEAIDLKVLIPFENCGELDRNVFVEKQLLKVSVSMIDRVNHLMTLTLDAPDCGPIAKDDLPNYFTASWQESKFGSYMRREQSHKLSMKSVVRGVDHIKAKRFTEAIQALNKALQVEEDNVEALVARGAAMIHLENYEMAAKDLEGALKVQSDHNNAREYLLCALDKHADKLIKSLTTDGRSALKAAVAANQKILQLEPDNKNALDREQSLKTHLKASSSEKKRKRKTSNSSDVLSVSSNEDSATKSAKRADRTNQVPTSPLQSMVRHYAQRNTIDKLELAQRQKSALYDDQQLKLIGKYYGMYAGKKKHSPDGEVEVIEEAGPSSKLSGARRSVCFSLFYCLVPLEWIAFLWAVHLWRFFENVKTAFSRVV